MNSNEVNEQMEEPIESFTCGYCFEDLGILSSIIEDKILEEHACFRNCGNVLIDYEDLKIFHANGESKACVHSGNEKRMLCPKETSTVRKGETWTDEMVKLLILIYKDHKHKFDSPNFTKKKVWETISSSLNKFRYNKSASKCDEKWRNLKKSYDKVRGEMNKTGNSKVSWKFFDEFQAIYWKDPHFVPLATASTSGTYSKRKLDGDTITELRPAKIQNNLSPGEKARDTTFTAREIENRKQKRHNEKKDLKREMFEWFKRNYEKQKEDQD